MRKIPSNIREVLFKKAFIMADVQGYTSNNNRENTLLMDRMLDDLEIGGKLQQFMSDVEARVYIKDVVLHKYSTEKRHLTKDEVYNLACKGRTESFNEVHMGQGVYLLGIDKGKFMVVSSGTHLKWESALRKILLYIGGRPKLSEEGKELKRVLVLTTSGINLRTGDEALLRKSLSNIGVEVVLV